MNLRLLPGKAIRFVWWRVYLGLSLHLLADRLARRWGWVSRRVRFALPQAPPYRRNELHIYRDAGLGDVLLCTPALRALKELNPNCHVSFYTDFPSLVQGLPFIDQVRPADEAPSGRIELVYENSIPPQRHLAQLIGDHLGIDVRDVRPSCVVDQTERDRYRESWKELPRPWIMVNRKAGPWTRNKDWPEGYWESLIDRILGWATVIEIGQAAVPERDRDPERYLSLIGKTSLDQLVAAIAAADLLVGPDSGPLHIAAAFRVPAVVIYGGYIHPKNTSYEGNVNLYSPVPCAPCWLLEPCPFDKKCLRQIEPVKVEESLKTLWARRTTEGGH